ncbi:hypothetical protein WDZ92_20310 [Nostoc sp. NIES-2111]
MARTRIDGVNASGRDTLFQALSSGEHLRVRWAKATDLQKQCLLNGLDAYLYDLRTWPHDPLIVSTATALEVLARSKRPLAADAGCWAIDFATEEPLFLGGDRYGVSFASRSQWALEEESKARLGQRKTDGVSTP